jgi:glutamyl-tRNA synthetase
VGRLAPSPTGYLHLGHAWTFWQAAERARICGGRLLLRIDDLDRERSRPEFIAACEEDLRWLGLRWDAAVVRQSERVGLYRDALERLIGAGLAYPCVCSRRELAVAALAPHDEDDEPVYSGRCRSVSATDFREGVNYRLRTPDGERVVVADGNLGPQAYECGGDFGDFLLWRKDGVPSYQLATVVDDAAMGVTEVVRGRDLLKSAARQMLVVRGLGIASPAWFHVELLRDDQGVRLAKRHDALAIRKLRERGMTADEVIHMATGRTQCFGQSVGS